MAVVGLKMAQEIKDANGFFKTDCPQVRRIVAYTSPFGPDRCYGVELAHEVGRYAESYFVQDPVVFFEAVDEIVPETSG